jgi:hypothetical protein
VAQVVRHRLFDSGCLSASLRQDVFGSVSSITYLHQHLFVKSSSGIGPSIDKLQVRSEPVLHRFSFPLDACIDSVRRLRQAPGAPSSNSAVSAWKKERKGVKLGALVGTSRALYTPIIGLVGKLKILKVLDQDTSWYFEVVISILCRCMIVLSFQSSTFDLFCLMSGMIFTLQPGLPFGFLLSLKNWCRWLGRRVRQATARGFPKYSCRQLR